MTRIGKMRINKLICLALLCALCVGETWAQRGKRAMNRIDREVQETVFIPKGTWMAGGTVSYSEHDEGNLNFLVLKNVEGKGYNFGVSPYVGYFFRNNISAGMRFALRIHKPSRILFIRKEVRLLNWSLVRWI